MAGENFQIEIRDMVTPRLGKLIAALGPGGRSAATKAVGEYMTAKAHDRFAAQGFDGSPWPERSEATVRNLVRAGKAGANRILVVSGRLKNSITYQADENECRVGVGGSLVYGRIHNRGGWAGRGRKVKIPQRQFIGIDREDKVEIPYLILKTLKAGG